jgi:hypothetical protein
MAGIQHIDFSQKLSGSTVRRAVPEQNPAMLSRLVGWGFACAILVFTAGIIAGLKIAELRNIEKNLVKYPDTKTFANTATEPAAFPEEKRRRVQRAAERARLIIRIGAFSAKRAGELARSLNQIEELHRIPYHPCQGIEDLNPDRAHVFAVPVEGTDRHRLFAGCYTTKEEAIKALEALRSTGVASLKESRLFELE